MQYLIAYDIADPKRLRRVAQCLEKHALRCQKSVFLFRGDELRVKGVLDELMSVIKLKEDLVQAWRLGARPGGHGDLCRGTPAYVRPEAVIVSGHGEQFIQGDAE